MFKIICPFVLEPVENLVVVVFNLKLYVLLVFFFHLDSKVQIILIDILKLNKILQVYWFLNVMVFFL